MCSIIGRDCLAAIFLLKYWLFHCLNILKSATWKWLHIDMEACPLWKYKWKIWLCFSLNECIVQFSYWSGSINWWWQNSSYLHFLVWIIIKNIHVSMLLHKSQVNSHNSVSNIVKENFRKSMEYLLNKLLKNLLKVLKRKTF